MPYDAPPCFHEKCPHPRWTFIASLRDHATRKRLDVFRGLTPAAHWHLLNMEEHEVWVAEMDALPPCPDCALPERGWRMPPLRNRRVELPQGSAESSSRPSPPR